MVCGQVISQLYDSVFLVQLDVSKQEFETKSKILSQEIAKMLESVCELNVRINSLLYIRRNDKGWGLDHLVRSGVFIDPMDLVHLDVAEARLQGLFSTCCVGVWSPFVCLIALRCPLYAVCACGRVALQNFSCLWLCCPADSRAFAVLNLFNWQP
jgi:hypothetical protein